MALLTGCMAQSAERLKSANQGIAVGPSVTTGDDCELRLFIDQRQTEGIYAIDNDKLGVAAVTQLDRGTLVDGVCIKHTDEPLEIPAPIRVAGDDDRSLQRFCSGTIEHRSSTRDKKTLSVCDWNGSFHAARPFTFTLVTNKQRAVAEFVDFARIYRNGDLMAAWNAAGHRGVPNQVRFEGGVLRSHVLSVSQPPNEASLDLRLVPHGGTALESVDLVVRQDEKLFRDKLERAATAAYAETFPKGEAVRDNFDCLKQSVVDLRAQVMSVVRSGVAPVAAAKACSISLGLPAGTPLSAAYAGATAKTSQELTELKATVQTTLATARDNIAQQLPQFANQKLEVMLSALFAKAPAVVQAALKQELAKDPQPDILQYLESARDGFGLSAAQLDEYAHLVSGTKELIGNVDEQVKLALHAVDEARAFVVELDAQASAIARDPNRQAQIFNAVAQSLAEQGETFEERRANPPLLADEQQLPMSYTDPFQFFLLAPWNGVPIRTGSHTGGDLNGAVAIPLVDIFGGRYQFGKSRFGDVRFAVGLGYTQTDNVNDDKTVTSKAAALPNVSIGAANLKFGVGLVTSDTDAFKNKLRWIIGADLYKLLSGRNIEAL